jgi:hypothetical protein
MKSFVLIAVLAAYTVSSLVVRFKIALRQYYRRVALSIPWRHRQPLAPIVGNLLLLLPQKTIRMSRWLIAVMASGMYIAEAIDFKSHYIIDPSTCYRKHLKIKNHKIENKRKEISDNLSTGNVIFFALKHKNSGKRLITGLGRIYLCIEALC